MVITGIPAATALSMLSFSSAGSATATRIPVAFFCTAWSIASRSPLGS